MKTLLLTIAFIFSTHAHSQSMILTERANLDIVSIDAYSPLNSYRLETASLNINNADEVLTLSVDRAVLSLAIQSITYTSCGARQINAQDAEGIMSVQVIDHTNSHCLRETQSKSVQVDVFTLVEEGLYAHDLFEADYFFIAYNSGIVEGNGPARKVEIGHQMAIEANPIQAYK